MPILRFGNAEIAYEIVRTKRRLTVGFIVEPDEKVLVRAPVELDATRIEEIVHKKAHWILSRLRRIQSVQVEQARKEFVSGESFLYLGRSYRLKVQPDGVSSPEVKLHASRFWVSIPFDMHGRERSQVVREALINWYREQAGDILSARVLDIVKRIGAEPAHVVVKNQRSRWGSCTKDGVLNLNWRLVMAPTSVVDYVVAHELCHLKIRNHSKEFWRFLGAVLPDYEKRREWLKVNGPYLSF